MSKVEPLRSELRKVSQTDLRQIREWLADIIELEFTPKPQGS